MYIAFPDKKPVCLDDVAITEGRDACGLDSPTCTSGFFTLIWLTDWLTKVTLDTSALFFRTALIRPVLRTQRSCY